MTLLFIDGFDDSLWNKAKWKNGFGGGATQTGRVVGSGLPYSRDYLLKAADQTDTLIFGSGFKWDGNDNRELFGVWGDGGTTKHVYGRIRSNGQIQVFRGDGTFLGQTAKASPLVGGAWYHFEVKPKLHDSTGSVVVRIDEVTVLTLSGIDTKNGGTNTVFDMVRYNEFENCVIDDVYVCNNAGSVNNDFLGDCVVLTSLPTGNGASSALLGSDGNSVNNYALVNESAADTTTYVGSATSGDKDTYAMADLAYTSGTIKGVQVAAYAAKSDAGAKTARNVVRSGGTDYPGSDVALSTTYLPYLEIKETDPDTGAAWTISGFNAAEFGFEARP